GVAAELDELVAVEYLHDERHLAVARRRIGIDDRGLDRELGGREIDRGGIHADAAHTTRGLDGENREQGHPRGPPGQVPYFRFHDLTRGCDQAPDTVPHRCPPRRTVSNRTIESMRNLNYAKQFITDFRSPHVR